MQDFQHLVQVAKFGKITELKELIGQGADLNQRGEGGLTALDLANQNYHLNAANVLKKYDALEGKYL